MGEDRQDGRNKGKRGKGEGGCTLALADTYDTKDDVKMMTLKEERTHFSSNVASLAIPDAAAAAATVAAQHSQWEEGALDCSRFAAEMDTGSVRWCGCR